MAYLQEQEKHSPQKVYYQHLSFNKSLYLHNYWGVLVPITAVHFILEIPLCNGNTIQIYLNEFSKQNEEELKGIVLDNGAFHKAKSLEIPKNLVLVFLPPYNPELNPDEKIWAKFKRKFSNNYFKIIEDLETFVFELANSLTPKIK